MEKLVSYISLSNTVPENFVFPENRPGEHVVPICKNVPIIDLGGNERKMVVHQIMEAARIFGFFQVINHGVPTKLMDDARGIFKEFFELPAEEKLKFYSGDYRRKCAFYPSSYVYEKETIHFWRDALKHSCTPLEECMQHWPQKPAGYRKVAGEYTVEVKKMGSRILELICEGLGVEPGYFEHGLTEEHMLILYNYPPCPNPSLTWGMGKHTDPNLMTILLQDHVSGFQFFKDGVWMGVEPISDAFVINIADQMQIVSNGKLRSSVHRVATNVTEARNSASFFIHPAKECLVKPADAVVTPDTPPLYKPVKYEEYFDTYTAGYRDKTDQSTLDDLVVKKA